MFPPEAMIMQLATGGFVAQAVHTAASLDIADLLAEGPRTADDLAAEAQTQAVKGRTEVEFVALLTHSGFRLTKIIPTASPVAVVEAMKA